MGIPICIDLVGRNLRVDQQKTLQLRRVAATRLVARKEPHPLSGNHLAREAGWFGRRPNLDVRKSYQPLIGVSIKFTRGGEWRHPLSCGGFLSIGALFVEFASLYMRSKKAIFENLDRLRRPFRSLNSTLKVLNVKKRQRSKQQ